MAKCYSAALPVLDQEFDDVDPKKTGMTARDFLLFCYYGGIIYTGGAATLTVSGLQTSVCQDLVRPWRTGKSMLMADHLLVRLLPAHVCSPCILVLHVKLAGLYRDVPAAHAGLKDHVKALAMFLFALTAPTMVVNAITMAAFRKHVLVSLIHTGQHCH